MSRPTGRSRLLGRPPWPEPCGPTDSSSEESDSSGSPRTTQELLGPLLNATKIALNQAYKFSKEWVGKTFFTEFWEHHMMWRHNSFEWLPSKEEIPNNLGEKISDDVLERIKNKSLKEILSLLFRHMQKYAVVLQLALLDQETYSDGWQQHFDHMIRESKAVLCEMHTVLVALGEDTTDDVSGEEIEANFYADSSSSYRNSRDWAILRDFMITLEYIKEVCEFFSVE